MPISAALPTFDLVACCTPLTGSVIDALAAEQLARAFKALGDPARVRLLSLIAAHEGGEACVCDLIDPVGLAQPTVSHHLKVLREAGWIVGERRGTWVWYSLRPEAVARFRELAGGFGPAVAAPLATRRLPVFQPSA